MFTILSIVSLVLHTLGGFGGGLERYRHRTDTVL